MLAVLDNLILIEKHILNNLIYELLIINFHMTFIISSGTAVTYHLGNVQQKFQNF